MSKTFFPEISETIPASAPHPPDTFYKVSVGLEEWDSNYVPVVKVQMVYNGKISGRRSPSYPLGTDDHIRVKETINKLLEKHATNHRKG